MKLEYARIDLLNVINASTFGLVTGTDTYQNNTKWLKGLPDVEYREDYQCFFVLKGSPSHTAIALKLGDIFG